MVNRGISSIFRRLAASTIYTNEHFVSIEYEPGVDKSIFNEIYSYLEQPDLAKITHGTKI